MLSILTPLLLERMISTLCTSIAHGASVNAVSEKWRTPLFEALDRARRSEVISLNMIENIFSKARDSKSGQYEPKESQII